MTCAEKTNAHPYESLMPETVLDALATLGLHGDGRLMALNSYENRVYLAHLEDGRALVLKFYRPDRWSDAQIAEEHSFSNELLVDEVPAVAPLVLQGATLHRHGGFAFSVSPYRGGRRPELDDFEVLEWVGRFLARIHQVGAARPFIERPALDLHSYGLAARDWLLGQAMIPPGMRRDWERACGEACALVAGTALGSAPGSALKKLRLHGDLHPGNILWTPTDRPGGGPHFVDLDDARTGFAVQDLWMLLSGDRAQRSAQLGGLLDGYEQLRAFDRRELALIEPLRTLRQIHYSAWLARRWSDPIFPINFPWFGSDDYWREQVRMLQAQCEAMALEPLRA
ncbi:serine/threonine protein kinase [Verminephrobacter aporrectodeae]|uniref:serine/threonine protein kinase n=1 Tax=Verminephrobacter aporrectodeae TaxID=1110389 RepID=UPI00223859CE|nr:serine/threonine protein kinase [Verminephrobacter aporrectodeae]MCW5220470.1 serine/threonine protein kinase [Verminephrobacter aporrectodeae subsp. tuberculatae]MCW5255572.1 serine/threonine protein kinase [Verminephrobacter aporrectodeae subsp. tuberculatae]MCW5289766.1 serine/threonine protein kinase [Verminephrobacter aporrectodeae subsp. tuberculatae]MCW8177090.1 serine/threonine protein kinase [Verminephrobacter aporrectodeae subsp. tuberculatae]MCW8198405.1 serine/threonine protein 